MSGLGESNVHAGCPRIASKAFTMIEIMIALAVLVTLAAVTLPSLITRGLDDTRADTEARLNDALLDARREAQRTGQTTEIVWTQAPGRTGETVALIVVQTLRPDQANPDVTDDEPEDEFAALLPGSDSESLDADPQQQASDRSRGGDDNPEGFRATLGYTLPDGSFVPADASFRFELDGRLYSLEFEALAARARFERLADDTEMEDTP